MFRLFVALLPFLLPIMTLAQNQQVHRFVAEGELDQHAVKSAYDVVISLDPQSNLSFDGARLKVLSVQTPTQLLAALNSNGTAYYRLDVPVERAMIEVDPSFPVRIDTGDPTGDDERYQLAKQAWIAANPEAYSRMTTGMDTVQPNKQH